MDFWVRMLCVGLCVVCCVCVKRQPTTTEAAWIEGSSKCLQKLCHNPKIYTLTKYIKGQINLDKQTHTPTHT